VFGRNGRQACSRGVAVSMTLEKSKSLDFVVDQPLVVRPVNSVYQGSYQTRILSVDAYSLEIEVPREKGKLVLLPVGTLVSVAAEKAPGLDAFEAEVLDRRLTGRPSLTISRPDVIARVSRRETEQRGCRVLAVASGKGGVGKTVFSLNYGLALADLGYRVYLVDSDLGTANLDVLLNLEPRYNLSHVVQGEKGISEIVLQGPAGIHLVPGGSGIKQLADLSEWQFSRLIAAFNELTQQADVLILDTGAGISRNVTNFLAAADEIIVVSTPEPHAVMDAYALLKVLAGEGRHGGIKLVLNRAQDAREGLRVGARIRSVAKRYLGLEVSNLGFILEDGAVTKAVRSKVPLLLAFPNAPSSRCFRRLAAKGQKQAQGAKGRRTSFVDHLRRLFFGPRYRRDDTVGRDR